MTVNVSSYVTVHPIKIILTFAGFCGFAVYSFFFAPMRCFALLRYKKEKAESRGQRKAIIVYCLQQEMLLSTFSFDKDCEYKVTNVTGVTRIALKILNYVTFVTYLTFVAFVT
ncbi:MAG: hypothetical protein PHQ96_08500 [Candidatus Omnitrophica bacterium]|nr:hypothetical protein [Candidatus Omnitrophota bacterium]